MSIKRCSLQCVRSATRGLHIKTKQTPAECFVEGAAAQLLRADWNVVY